MATEVDRLVVVFDANFQRLEEKMNKVIRSNYAASKKIEKNWKQAGVSGAMDELTGSLKSAASGIPVVGGALSALGSTALAVTGVIGGLAIAFTGAANAMQWADDLDAMASKLGITSEALQELQYAAEASDVSTEALQEGLQKLNGALGAMKTGVGSAKVTKAFEALGISKEALANVNDAAQLLPLVSDRLATLGSVAEQVQVAKKLGLEQLLPMLRGGSAELEALTERARSLGLVLDNDTVTAMADANEEMRVATKVIQAQLMPVFAGLAVTIGNVSTSVIALIGWFRKLAQEYPTVAAVLNQSSSTLMNPGVTAGNWVRKKLGLDPVATGAAADLEKAKRSFNSAFDRELKRQEALEIAAASGVGGGGGGAAAKRARGGGAGRAATEPPKLEDVEVVDFAQARADAEAIEQMEWIKAAIRAANEPIKPFDTSGLVETTEAMAKIGEDLGHGQGTEDIRNSVYDGIRGGLEAGFRDGLPGVLDYLQDALTRSVLDSIAEGLTNAVMRNSNSTGGLLTSLATALFGRGYAEGTLSSRHGLALVGERGPELVNLPGGSKVIPNAALRNVAMGGRGGSGAPTIVFDNRGAVIWEQAARQMMGYADRAAATAGVGALQTSRRVTPDDLARQGGRRLGR